MTTFDPTPNVPLSQVIYYLALKAGLTADQIQLTNIDDNVNGFILNQRESFWDMMKDMATFYQLDIFESDAKVKFVRAGKGDAFSYAATLQSAGSGFGGDDLGWVTGDESNNDRSNHTVNFNPANTPPPVRLEMRYLNPAAQYTVDLVYAQRTTFPVATVADSSSTSTLAIPVAMGAAEALVRLTKSLYALWIGLDKHQLRLLPKFLALEPSDALHVYTDESFNDGVAFTLKISEVAINGDGSLSITAGSYATEDAVTIAGSKIINVPTQIIPFARLAEDGSPRITETGAYRIIDTNFRLTETGVTRVTEDGFKRTTESHG